MYKNTANQKIAIFAWNSALGVPMTGDAVNITAQISKDCGACAVSNDINPIELDTVNAKGVYVFDPTQAESNCDLLLWSAVSSTADVDILPEKIYTQDLSAFKATGFSTHTPTDVKTAIETAGSFLETVKNQVGYTQGCIWIDTNNGSPGSVVGVNGIFTNPVDNWADVLLLSAALNIKRLYFANQSSIIILDLELSGFSFYGDNYGLTLSGVFVNEVYIENAFVTGTCINSHTNAIQFKNCNFDVIILTNSVCNNCGFANTIYLSTTAGTCIFNSCYNKLEAENPIVLHYHDSTINHCVFNNWTGEIEIKEITLNNTLSISGRGKVIINSNCVNGIITIAGDFEVVDEVVGGFQGTINQETLFNKTETRESIGLASANLDTQLETIQTDLDTSLPTIQETINRVLGLTQENQYIDTTVYEGKNLLSARLRIYSDAVSVGTDLNVLATYTIIGTYTVAGMQTYTMVKV